MAIENGKIVSIDYKLTNESGTLLDSSEGREPLAYLHGAGQIVSGLEKELEGKEEGASVQASVPPEEAYGKRDESLVGVVPRDRFQGVDDIQPGMQFQASTPQGSQIITVRKVEESEVTVDANHPLAGEVLNFDVTVRGVRDATEEEKSHGDTQGEDGAQPG